MLSRGNQRSEAFIRTLGIYMYHVELPSRQTRKWCSRVLGKDRKFLQCIYLTYELLLDSVND